jgi:tetratricopeptide (TPR) repeat protein
MVIRPARVAAAVRVLVASALIAATIPVKAAQDQQQPEQSRPRRVTPAELTPREALEQARSSASADEQITLLEKFVAANRGVAIEIEAREALMRAYALRGEQRLREGNPQSAASDFRAAFRSAPADITNKVFSQYIFPMPMAMNSFGYRAESVELMKTFEPRFRSDANRLVQIGFFYIQIEAPLEAVRTLERAVELAPHDSRTHNSLGSAYLINLRLDDAQAEFRRALDLNPQDEYANLNLAHLLRAKGATDRAIDYYNRQLAINPDDPEGLSGLTLALLAAGRDEEAERSLKRALELGPDNYRLYTQLAFFYAGRKRTPVARHMVERAGRIEPRYAWAHIAKANIDSLEGKHGDALATIMPAQNLASFPSLGFEVAKALVSLDGYDQAIEILGRNFTLTEDGEFEAMLGGVMKARSPRLDLLLERERQAALFLNDQLTTPFQYRLAESLARIDHFIRMVAAAKAARAARPARPSSPRGQGARGRPTPGSRSGRTPQPLPPAEDLSSATRARRAAIPDISAELSAGSDASFPGADELLRAIKTFTTLDDGRQAFRAVWVARKLAENGVALDAAELLARRAIAVAAEATEPDDSMRDAPLLDRQGRLAIFLGRAEDALGWALLKKGNLRGAIEHLTKAIDTYPVNAERKNAVWHLGVAMEETGDEPRALDLYIAAYQPDLPTSSTRRARIESLYKKLKGTTDGLEEKLKRP